MADYGTEFKSVLLALKQEGVGGGVFGDIDLEEHRQWVERVCGEVDVMPYLPLWGQAQIEILRDFIELGFEAIVVVAKTDLFSEYWLGRRVDLDFLSYLQANDISLCGEAGEYHTFVTDGPMFNQRIEILETNKVLREGRWFLEILDCELKAKG